MAYGLICCGIYYRIGCSMPLFARTEPYSYHRSEFAGKHTQTDSTSTDFDSVKERVDRANNTTGKEVKSLYMGEGKSSMQKQLETRLFFNTVKEHTDLRFACRGDYRTSEKGFQSQKRSRRFWTRMTNLRTVRSPPKLRKKPRQRMSRQRTMQTIQLLRRRAIIPTKKNRRLLSQRSLTNRKLPKSVSCNRRRERMWVILSLFYLPT